MDSPKVFYNHGIYLSINWKHCGLFMGCSQLIHSCKLLGYIETMPKAVISSLACSPLCVLYPVSRSAFQPFCFSLWKQSLSHVCSFWGKILLYLLSQSLAGKSWTPPTPLQSWGSELPFWTTEGLLYHTVICIPVSGFFHLPFLTDWVSLPSLSQFCGLKKKE